MSQDIEIITHTRRQRTKPTLRSFILPLTLILWPWLALPLIFLLYTASTFISPPEFLSIIINIVLFVLGFFTIIASLPSFVIGIILLIIRSKGVRIT